MRRIAACGALSFMIALGSGCDYFRPAQPEAPVGTAIIPDYSDPDSTLTTLSKAMADKGVTNGSSVYAEAFAESVTISTPGYHQLFWPEDVLSYRQASGKDPPGDWNFLLEQSFYSRFIRLRGDAYRMSWAKDPLNPDDVGLNGATIHRHYLVWTESDGVRTSIQAIGFADLTMLRGTDGNWRIVRWEDRRDPGADLNDTDQVTLGRRRLNTQ